jgi:hypothetical protein
VADKRSITELYAMFVKVHDSCRVAEVELNAVGEGGAAQKEFERLLEKCSRIARRLVRTPAADIDEILLRLRVTAWDIGHFRYARLEDLDRWRPDRFSKGIEYEALAATRDDLVRLRAALEPPCT